MSARTETEVLEKLLPELEAEGYEVYLHPNRRILPAFLGGYVPDVIALRDDKNLVIEITQQFKKASGILGEILARFKDQPNWEFRIIWLEPTNTRRDLKVQTSTAITEQITDINELLTNGSSQGAFLLAWATFEALGRALLPDQFQRPQTPARLIEILAKQGYVTPSEGDVLRTLAEKRNNLIHGELQTRVAKSDLQKFTKILRVLLAELVPDGASSSP